VAAAKPVVAVEWAAAAEWVVAEWVLAEWVAVAAAEWAAVAEWVAVAAAAEWVVAEWAVAIKWLVEASSPASEQNAATSRAGMASSCLAFGF
jgi:hypothetical protein